MRAAACAIWGPVLDRATADADAACLALAPHWIQHARRWRAKTRWSKAMVLKVAVAGTGYFSRFHFDAWSRLPEVRLVAVCSLDPAGLVDAAARHLIPRQFADVGAMLDATDAGPARHRDAAGRSSEHPEGGRTPRGRRHLPETARRRSRNRAGNGPDRPRRGNHLRRTRELPVPAVVSRGQTAARRGRARRRLQPEPSGCDRATARGRAPIWIASRTFSRCRVS